MWTGAKAAEIMKEASLAENEKVIVGGVRFFLGADKEREELEDESSDEETVDIGKLKHQIGINKKSKKQTRRLEKAVTTVKKVKAYFGAASLSPDSFLLTPRDNEEIQEGEPTTSAQLFRTSSST